MDDFQSTTQAPEFAAETDEVEPVGEEEAGESLGSRIADFLRTCWLKRRMIFGIVAVGILASLLYALVLPNMYVSTTTLMPPDNTSPYSSIMGLLSPGSAAAQLGGEALGLNTPSDLFIGILKSRNVQDGLINGLDLAHHYRSRDVEEARKSLEGATKIDEDRSSGVIMISVTDTNPVTASRIAGGYVEELNRVVTDNATSAARRERIFLEERVKEVKQNLDDSAKQLSQFSTKSGAIDISSQTRSMVEEGLRLQAELIDGRSQLAALRQTYSEDNSRVRALEAHNTELQKELDKMGGLTQGSGANTGANESPYITADELPALGVTYFDLERKVRVDEALWETLTKQYEAAKVEEAEEIPTVEVLDRANVPLRKSSPSRRLIVELGAILSFAFACALVFTGMIWEGMDPEGETKRLVTDAATVVMDSKRWYWRLPAMNWIHRRLTRSEVTG
jgi:capsule polysaccharide export protein KpsE/RkpR